MAAFEDMAASETSTWLTRLDEEGEKVWEEFCSPSHLLLLLLQLQLLVWAIVEEDEVEDTLSNRFGRSHFLLEALQSLRFSPA